MNCQKILCSITRNLSAIAMGGMILSCNDSAKEQVIQEVSVIDSIQTKAHYLQDPVLLGSIMADSFHIIRNGVVSNMSKQKMVDQFANYFKNVKYLYWGNVSSPFIILSDDHKMAAVTYHKNTISLRAETRGKIVRDTTFFAWTAVMKKTTGGWKIFQITTTDHH